MSRCVTTADFLKRAREIHGDRYDYSKVLYRAADKKVTIICPEHGEFKQAPINHCSGRGCYECGANKPLTLEIFIERANKIHKGRFDYSRVKFKKVESKVEIICPDHGLVLFRDSPVFEIIPGRMNEAYQTIVRYKDENLLKSGWLDGEDRIAKKSATITTAYGVGKIVLIGFRTQHRNQTDGTFKLLFNTIIE